MTGKYGVGEDGGFSLFFQNTVILYRYLYIINFINNIIKFCTVGTNKKNYNYTGHIFLYETWNAYLGGEDQEFGQLDTFF